MNSNISQETLDRLSKGSLDKQFLILNEQELVTSLLFFKKDDIDELLLRYAMSYMNQDLTALILKKVDYTTLDEKLKSSYRDTLFTEIIHLSKKLDHSLPYLQDLFDLLSSSTFRMAILGKF